MPPSFPLNRVREVDFARLATLDPEQVLADLNPDGQRWLVGDFAWPDVRAWLATEALAVAEIDGATETAEDFDQRAADYPFEADEPWPVDVGATAMVAALNAAGCPTAWSTRGDSQSNPGVVFFADEARTRLLLAIAERHNLRLSMTDDGLLDLAAGSVGELLQMAAEMLDWRETFDALPGPATASLRGSDGYWVHDLEELRELLQID